MHITNRNASKMEKGIQLSGCLQNRRYQWQDLGKRKGTHEWRKKSFKLHTCSETSSCIRRKESAVTSSTKNQPTNCISKLSNFVSNVASNQLNNEASNGSKEVIVRWYMFKPVCLSKWITNQLTLTRADKSLQAYVATYQSRYTWYGIHLRLGNLWVGNAATHRKL